MFGTNLEGGQGCPVATTLYPFRPFQTERSAKPVKFPRSTCHLRVTEFVLNISMQAGQETPPHAVAKRRRVASGCQRWLEGPDTEVKTPTDLALSI